MRGVSISDEKFETCAERTDIFISDQFPVPTAARTAKAGLVVAMAFGLAQDMVSLARGHRLAYVDFLTGKKPGYYSTSEAD